MVKLKGPGLSLAAGGSIADTVSFGTWKGRSYLRSKAKPQQPDSRVQLSYRAVFGWLTQRWPKISSGNQATWAEAARAANLEPHAFYLKFNIDGWNRDESPSDIFPALRTWTNLGYAGGWPTCVTAENAALYEVKFNPNAATHGAMLYRWPTLPMDLTRPNVIAVFDIVGTDVAKIYDRNLAIGEYYYRIRPFNERGHQWNTAGQRWIEIT